MWWNDDNDNDGDYVDIGDYDDNDDNGANVDNGGNDDNDDKMMMR